MKSFLLKSILTFLVLIMMVAGVYGQTLYATDGRGCTSSTLYELNPNNGSIVTVIGSTGVSGLTSIAVHPTTGVLYALSTGGGDCTSSLYTLNTNSGLATLVGPTGLSGGRPDMSFRSDGTLFTYRTSNGYLYTVNLSSGAMSSIGDTGVSPWDIGLAFDLSDTLIMTNGDTVFTVNTVTGLAASIAPMPGTNDSNMMTTHPDTGAIYLGDSDNSSTTTIYILNPSTGVLTLLGSNPIPDMSAIEFAPSATTAMSVPTMTEWGMIVFIVLAGIGAIYFLRRNRAVS